MIKFNSNYPNQLQDQVLSVSLKPFGYTRSSYISSKKKKKKVGHFWIYTIVNFFKTLSPLSMCVKILSI